MLDEWAIIETYIDYPRVAREEEPTDEELRLVEAQEDMGFWQ